VGYLLTAVNLAYDEEGTEINAEAEQQTRR
jgi:hypothetical protein